MSDVPCKKFSAVLQDVVTLNACGTTDRNHEIPKQIRDFKDIIVKALEYRNVVFSYGIMGSTSERFRYISNQHYEMHLKLKLPFEITPIRDEARKGFVQLQAGEQAEHPVIVNGYVDRGAIHQWLHNTFKAFFGGSLEFYKICSINYPTWALNCIPVLEFDTSDLPKLGLTETSMEYFPWYAIPRPTLHMDKRSFQAWSPDWERHVRESHPYYHKVEFLMMRLFAVHKITFADPKEVVQAVIMNVILNETNVATDLGLFLITVLESFVGHLEEDSLTSRPGFTKNINLFRCVSEAAQEYYHGVAAEQVCILKRLKSEALADETAGNEQGNWINNLKSVFK